ncbi:membrane protein of ER body-like protein, partial [Tanacetum coccineum]
RKRLAKMKQVVKIVKFGSIIPISGSDFVREVLATTEGKKRGCTWQAQLNFGGPYNATQSFEKALAIKEKVDANGGLVSELDIILKLLMDWELAEDGYSGVEVRFTPMRAQIIIRAARTQTVLVSIVDLALATLIEGVFVIGHNLWDLREDYYKESSSQQESLQHYASWYSGWSPPVAYGYAFHYVSSKTERCPDLFVSSFFVLHRPKPLQGNPIGEEKLLAEEECISELEFTEELIGLLFESIIISNVMLYKNVRQQSNAL